MIQTTPISQRDPRWANITLGFGPGTISQYGCTVTAITMLLNSKGAGLNPQQVNDIMKDKGAFAGDPANLVWWAKLPQAFPQITSVFKYYSYDNEVVKGLIKQGYPVVVCVDGTPIGSSQHWVLYIGDQTLLDPWDGKGKPTSTYKALEFVSMGVTAPVPTQPTDPCATLRDDFSRVSSTLIGKELDLEKALNSQKTLLTENADLKRKLIDITKIINS